MANKYAGTKTEKNLWEAFAGESQARNKYTYFASVAKKAGYEQIAAIFEQTANNEKEHAKIWFKYLHGGKVPSTEANLLDAAEGIPDESYSGQNQITAFFEQKKRPEFNDEEIKRILLMLALVLRSNAEKQLAEKALDSYF